MHLANLFWTTLFRLDIQLVNRWLLLARWFQEHRGFTAPRCILYSYRTGVVIFVVHTWLIVGWDWTHPPQLMHLLAVLWALAFLVAHSRACAFILTPAKLDCNKPWTIYLHHRYMKLCGQATLMHARHRALAVLNLLFVPLLVGLGQWYLVGYGLAQFFLWQGLIVTPSWPHRDERAPAAFGAVSPAGA